MRNADDGGKAVARRPRRYSPDMQIVRISFFFVAGSPMRGYTSGIVNSL
jgi:hypothetical protein